MNPKTLLRDPRIDAYIAKAPEFSRPILSYLRQVVHSACPQVEETMKWSRPHFNYKGMLCGMSAFKQHCAFGFWKGSLLVKQGDNKNSEAMGQFGRITALKELPAKKQITDYIHAAMKLNDAGVKAATRSNRKPRKPLPVPIDLAAALRRNKAARVSFEGFSPSNQREYIMWLVEAKTETTRKRRLATTIEWLAAGKPRNWKYQSAKQ
jgi:uncharacterized protein YdeI (YjbR/CyaY-like superfamily)